MGAFNDPLVLTVLRGVARLSSHVPAPALPLARTDLIAVCKMLLTMGPDARVAMAALLFGVTTFLRQCNFLPSTRAGWTPHLICRADVSGDDRGLLVKVCSTKTRLVSDGPVTLLIAPAPGSQLCPVAACLWAWRAVPAHPDSPLFLLPSSGSALTATGLLLLLRSVLAGLSRRRPEEVTLHSLRRTGALLAASRGCPDAEVMAHGTWTSQAYRAYVPRPVSSSVPAAIATAWH